MRNVPLVPKLLARTEKVLRALHTTALEDDAVLGSHLGVRMQVIPLKHAAPCELHLYLHRLLLVDDLLGYQLI